MSRFLLILFLTFSIMLGVPKLQAQTVQQFVKLGDNLFNSGQYYGSIGYYKSALELDSTDSRILYKYGLNLARLNNNNMATRYMLKSYLLGGDALFDDLNYELAEAYRNNGEYRKAKRYYSRAIRPFLRQQDSYWYKRINQSEEAASWANRHKNEMNDEPLINLGSTINTIASEFCSSIHDGKLFFTSLRADSALKGYEIADRHYFSRIYYKGLGKVTAEELLIENEKENGLYNKHIGNLSFTKNNVTYFSACDTAYNCEIWTAKIEDNKLINLRKLNKNINYPSANNTQAQGVQINGYTYLYFVSNREGGFGDLDIWVSKKESFGFDKAINLGNEINTPGNEITPFYDTKSHQLYFSSDWHWGFGGYDIFSAQGATTVFENVENLKQPINSSSNDYYYQPHGDSAFLTSNRRKGNIDPSAICCNDIYKTQLKQAIPLAKNNIEGKDSLEIWSKKEVAINALNNALPSDLYFHNDEPNPNSRDTSTKESYLNLAFGYLSMQNEYILQMQSASKNNQDVEAIRQFFEKDVKQGVNSLLKFMPLLFQKLKSGSHLTITIRGFASSLSESDYNYALTSRRIESLINYMKSYRNGSLLPYINHTASNGGSLNFVKLPYGDFATKIKEFDNNKLAIYSTTAAKQRKIELIAINEDDLSNNVGKISFNKMKYDLGEVPENKEISRFFLMENTGNKEVKLYNVNTNCDCATVDYPITIKPNSKEKILVNINPSTIKGNVALKLMVVTNSNPNIYRLEINFTIPKN